MNRFYIERSALNGREQRAYIRDRAEITHITKALRLREGDQIEICAGLEDNYIASIIGVAKGEVALRLDEKIDHRELAVDVDLFQGIPKGHKWDYLIQKSVEGGVRDIYPIQMSRCVSIIKADAAKKKQQRWQKIADEAAKQSKRSYIPVVKQVLSVEQGMALMSDYDLVLIAYENEREMYLKHCQGAVEKAARIAIWIGPEGGLETFEIESLSAVGQIISLGKRIYRTESAALALLAQIGYIVEQ